MSPNQDAAASLTLALQKIERARVWLDEEWDVSACRELNLAKLAIEDAQSVLATENPNG